jgi:hypothetical protein
LEKELAGKATFLADFVDEILAYNAQAWDKERHFMLVQEVATKWSALLLRKYSETPKTEGNQGGDKKRDYVKKNPIMIKDPVLQHLENQARQVFSAIGRTISPNKKADIEKEVLARSPKITNLETEETARLLYWERLLLEARAIATGLNFQLLQGLTAVIDCS